MQLHEAALGAQSILGKTIISISHVEILARGVGKDEVICCAAKLGPQKRSRFAEMTILYYYGEYLYHGFCKMSVLWCINVV